MGLDMYLHARKYVSPNTGSFNKLEEKLSPLMPELKEGQRVCGIAVDFAYWRKANHVHRWFVENVQNGSDDCSEYYVSSDKIKKLLDEINEVLEDPDLAAITLPTKPGFFFGSIEFDDWYFDKLKYTKEILEQALSKEWSAWDFYYTSSW